MSDNRLNIDPCNSAISLKAQAYEAIKEAIVRMDIYAPDAKLRFDERDLSARFGVSRTPLREALAKGEIDALFGDALSLAIWLQAPEGSRCCRFLGGPFIDRRYFGEGLAIAVKKGNEATRRALDQALAAVSARGTYAELYLKYFPLGPY